MGVKLAVMNATNPLPFLLTLFCLFLISSLSTAQHQDPPARVVTAQDSARAIKIEKMMQHGPHRKNPRAAGRLRTINRVAPLASELPSRVQLMGPAYKNRGPVVAPVNTKTFRSSKRRLMGPAYKNRGAKGTLQL